MCFSAEASFATTVVLVPASLYALNKAVRLDNNYWAFALFPVIFGLQQALEGGVWLSLGGNPHNTRIFALGFLFCAFFFWPVWVPFSSYLTERNEGRKQLCFLLAILGFVFAVFLYVPVLLEPERINVSVLNLSIDYTVRTIYQVYIPLHIVTLIYGVFVLAPLLLSSDHAHRLLGMLIGISGFVTWVFFDLVFVSVWCYFSALISAYIIYIIIKKTPDISTPSA